LIAAARLTRRYHDATAGSTSAKGAEVVCHNDLSPCNFVFRDGSPIAIIDFDSGALGARSDDLGYALFLWLNLGTDGPPARERRGGSRSFATPTASPRASTSSRRSQTRSRETSSGCASSAG
jgi:aminoglycoside phosphotransferase (APT) family kinase protein